MAEKQDKYADIINLPHHISTTRHPMSMYDRAAQFSPFAALSGYGAAIRETERKTEKMAQLSEDVLSELDERLNVLISRLAERPTVEVTYFMPDERKIGGAYRTHRGVIAKIDSFGKRLHFEDGTVVNVSAVSGLQFTDNL